MKKLGLAFITAVLFCVLLCGIANAAGTSGTCGTNVTWNLSSSGKLTISGSGAMEDYSDSYYLPWKDNKDSITTVEIGYGITHIGQNAFYSCPKITNVSIASSVKSIGSHAFYWCSGLTSLTIPNGVISIEDYAFAECRALQNVTVSASVTSLGVRAFSGCDHMESISFSSGLTSIGEYAFSNCWKLINISIPASVTSIGEQAFLNCYNMTSIQIDSENPNYFSEDGVLFNKEKTTLIKFPHGKAGHYIIPSSVTSICDNAFYWCKNLTAVTIPVSVKNIGVMAFSSSTNLQEVIYLGNQTQWANVSISEYNSDLTEERLSITVSSGTCGVNASWRLDQHGVLTVSGEGAMNHYNAGYAPWNAYRSSIKTVKMCNGITSIGKNAFYNCTNLTSLTISDGVTSIGDQAFGGCTGLTGLSIPNSVTSIGKQAFNGCTGLTKAVIPGSVTSIGDQVFSGCTGLTNVTINSGVTEIGSQAFYNCYSLNSITIPSSVTSIGNLAFSYCGGLTGITLPQSLTSIGVQAFYYCSGLTEITIPDGVNNFRADSLTGCSNLNTVTIKGRTTELGGISSCGRSGNIDYLNGKNGTLLLFGTGTMNNYTKSQNYVSSDAPWGSFTKVIIDDGITSIGDNAFVGKQLTDVSIPNSVKSIGENAFYHCTGLNEVNLPDSITNIGPAAFSGCTGLSDITLPENLTNLERGAFYGCTGLTEIDLPNSLTSIEASLFSGCSILERVSIPESITSIGNYAFNQCGKLEEITITDNVTNLGKSVFAGCTSLSSITVPDSVTQLNSDTFTNYNGKILCSMESETALNLGKAGRAFRVPGSCYDLRYLFTQNQPTGLEISNVDNVNQSFEFPNGVTSIGANAFLDCTNLKNVSIPNSITNIGDTAFCGCINLESVSIANGISSISAGMFNGCTSLTSITLPDSIANISSAAFYDCTGMTSIIIPYRTSKIGANAFAGCTGLIEVKVLSSNATFASSVFDVNAENLSLTVLPGSTAYDYAVANGIPYTIYNSVNETGFLYSVDADQTITILGYEGTDSEVTIPSTIEGYTVRKIGANSFNRASSDLASISLPDSITSISNSAFDGCTARLYATANSSTAIALSKASNPFAPYGENYVIIHLCQGNQITGTTLIGIINKGISSFTVPGYITTIGNSAFSGCSNLSSIDMSSGIPIFSVSAFSGCPSSLTIALPNETVHVGDAVFGVCGDQAIYTCANGVLNIYGSGAIKDCPQEQYVISSHYSSYWDEWDYEYGYRPSAPWKNLSVNSIVVHEGITSIGLRAFEQLKSLTTVSFPASVTSVGSYVFNGCSCLANVYFPGDAPTIDNTAFSSVKGSIHYIPYSSWIGKIQNYGGSLIWVKPNGSCGSDVTWVLDSMETLRINGNGSISEASWTEYDDSILTMILSPGVTGANSGLFNTLPNLRQIIFEGDYPSYMAENAFSGVTATAYFPHGNTTWDSSELSSFGGNITWQAYCTHSGDTIDALQGEHHDEVAPDCVNNGNVEHWQCSSCHLIFSDAAMTERVPDENLVIPALGHKEVVFPGYSASCTEVGLTDGIFCEVCGEVIQEQEEIPLAEHTDSITIPEIPATCISVGYTAEHRCSVCNELLAEVEEIPFGDHTDKITVEAVEPTCTSVGYTAEHCCEVCGIVLEEIKEVPMIPHTDHISVAAVEPTCSAVGHTAEHRCEICNELLISSEEIAKLPHTDSVTIEYLAPTCTVEGHTEEHTCSVCGEVTAESEAIPATGHTYGTPTTAWSEDGKTCTFTFECVHEDDTKVVPVQAVGSVSVAPACLEKGMSLYTATAEVNEKTYSDTTTRVDIPATGHTEAEDPAVAPTDRQAGLTAGSHCSVCNTVLIPQETVPALWSYTDDGLTATAYNGTETDLTIPDGVTKLGDALFKNNTNITSVHVPSAVISLGTQTFYGTTGMTDIWLPADLDNIGMQTFHNTNAVLHTSSAGTTAKGISLRNKNFTDGDWTLRYKVTSVTSNPTAVYLVLWQGDDEELIVPETVGGAPVTHIQTSAFAGKDQLRTILIPDSVTDIATDAFTDCNENLVIRSSATATARTWASGNGVAWEHDSHTEATDEAVAPTCIDTGLTEGKHCSECGEVLIAQKEIPAAGHKMTAIAATVATCTEPGNNAYWKCSSCSKYFNDENGQEEIEENSWILAAGHAMTAITAQAATCTEPGNSAYWQCSSCNKYFSDADGKTEIDENSWIIPVTAHTLTEHAEVEATCTTAGTEAYWDCSVCKKLFSDKDANTEIEAPEVILAMDHDWDTPTYVWTTDNSEVTATRVCKHNPAHIETEKKGTIRELIVPPKETEAGAYQIVSKTFENPAFVSQTKGDQVIPALENMDVLKLPAFLKTIETEAFEGVSAEAIIIPEECTTIEPKAFMNCKNLLYIKIPAGLEIPADAFTGSPNIVIDQR